MEEITDELFQKYKHFYECLINDCLVANGIAYDNVNKINGYDVMNQTVKDDIQESINNYHKECKKDDATSISESEDDSHNDTVTESGSDMNDASEKYNLEDLVHQHSKWIESIKLDSEDESSVEYSVRHLVMQNSNLTNSVQLKTSESDSSESDSSESETSSKATIVKKKRTRVLNPSYKFYVMKATKNADGEETIDYPEFRILTGNYVYTQFQPYWMDGNEHINQPWDEIVFEEWYQPPNSETTSTTSSTQRMKYNRLRDELYTNTSGDQWTNHPMGKHYDQLAYYLSDFEGTFMPDV